MSGLDVMIYAFGDGFGIYHGMIEYSELYS
jgi:hypothetical protein